MTVFGVLLITLAALLLWSGITGRNGFAELAKLVRGEAAFA